MYNCDQKIMREYEMKETKKLAVIFPGIGYTADKPLLYYARRIAAEQGYEIMTIPYSGFPKKIRGDRKRMEESFRIALDQSEQLLAEVDGAVVGSAGIGCVGRREKTRHRARFGISVDKAYWGLGIGRALTEACIECAKTAGYVQLELEAVAENEHALALYRSVGFAEYGRNPKGFRSRISGWQAVVLMRLEL